MNRKNNLIREIFLRMQKAGKSVSETAQTLGIKRQTVYNWQKLNESNLLIEPSKNTRKPPPKLEEFKKYVEEQEHAFEFNKEIATAFNTTKSTIQRWRQRLDFTRKKAKTTYKEADSELKKNSKKI